MTDTTSTSSAEPMPFWTAVTTVVSKYADFTGRAGRAEFWWFILFSFVVSSALGSLNLWTPEGTIAIGSALAGMWSAIVFVPTLAVTVRRLRDAGRRWTEIFWILLPIAGLIVLIVHLAEPSKP